MNEIKDTEQSVETGKAAYVKPTMQVYELEVEETVLSGSGSGDPSDYPYGNGWSKADSGLNDNVFNA